LLHDLEEREDGPGEGTEEAEEGRCTWMLVTKDARRESECVLVERKTQKRVKSSGDDR
jgi:hypothetical protein